MIKPYNEILALENLSASIIEGALRARTAPLYKVLAAQEQFTRFSFGTLRRLVTGVEFVIIGGFEAARADPSDMNTQIVVLVVIAGETTGGGELE